MLKYFIVGVTSISYFISTANIANAEVKEHYCNAIKVKSNGFSSKFYCKPLASEIKIFYKILKEAYIMENKEGEGTSSVKIKELSLPESNNSEYVYLNFYEAKNTKIVQSYIFSNGLRQTEIEVSAITRVYKRTQTYGKLGESNFQYEFKTQFLSKGRARLDFDSISQTWKVGTLGHS